MFNLKNNNSLMRPNNPNDHGHMGLMLLVWPPEATVPRDQQADQLINKLFSSLILETEYRHFHNREPAAWTLHPRQMNHRALIVEDCWLMTSRIDNCIIRRGAMFPSSVCVWFKDTRRRNEVWWTRSRSPGPNRIASLIDQWGSIETSCQSQTPDPQLTEGFHFLKTKDN